MRERREGCDNAECRICRFAAGMWGNSSLVTSIFPTKWEVKSSAGNEGGSGDIWVLKKRIEEV